MTDKRKAAKALIKALKVDSTQLPTVPEQTTYGASDRVTRQRKRRPEKKGDETLKVKLTYFQED